MKRSLFFCLILSLSPIFPFAGEKAHRIVSYNFTQLKVLTWNIQMLPSLGAHFNKNLKKMQKERTAWIIDHLRDKDYDIIMLQECFDKDFIETLKSELAIQYPFQFLPIRPHWYKLSNGLMVLSKFALDYESHIVFNKSAQSDFFTAKGAVMLHAKICDQDYYFLNTHLQADYEEKFAAIRNSQLQEIQEKLLNMDTNAGRKILMAGDLNVEEDVANPEYQAMLKKVGLKDLVYSFFKRPTISFDQNNYWNRDFSNSTRLDYFIGNLIHQVSHIEIVRPKHLHNQVEIDLADHYGIAMSLDLSERIAVKN